MQSVARGMDLKYQVERKENEVELGVCRIRQRLPNRQGYQTVGSGSVVKDLIPEWSENIFIVTSDKALPEDFKIDCHYLEFKKLDSTIKQVPLSSVAKKNNGEYSVQRDRPSGLVVIPLDPKSADLQGTIPLMTKSGIQKHRPFSTICKKESTSPNEYYCHVVDDISKELFDVKSFKLTQNEGQYVLKDGEIHFKSFDELIPSNRKPHGAIILTSVNDELIAVGVLNFGDKKEVSPAWFSQNNLPTKRSFANQLPAGPVPDERKTEEAPGAAAGTCHGEAASKDQGDSSKVKNDPNQKTSKPNLEQGTFAIQLPAGPVPDERKTEEAPGAAAGTSHGEAASKDQGDSSKVKNDPNQKISKPNLEQGTFDTKPVALPVPEERETGGDLDATADTCDTVAASKHLEDPSRVRNDQNQKTSEPNPEQGNLSLKIAPKNTTSKNSEGQDSGYMEEKLDRAKKLFDLYSYDGLKDVLAYLKGHLDLHIQEVEKGCIKITVKCRTLEILERLWNDYRSGHLNEVVEKCLITEKVKDELDMETITLTTTILYEDYLACKLSLMDVSASASADDGQIEPKRELELREQELWDLRKLTEASTEEELTDLQREHDFSEEVPELTFERLKRLKELQKRETKSREYTQEQLNYFKIAYIVTNVLTRGLRLIFKREWDNRYKATFGEWQDTPQNGRDFYNSESPRNQKRNARLLATMVNGNTAEWDCTMLFYAILHSDSINGLSTTVRQSVVNLREFRNGEFAHTAHAKLSDPEFRIAIRKVEVAFKVLGLSTVEIHDISKQNISSSWELQNAMKEVQSVYQELQGTDVKLQMLEQQRQWQDWQQGDASSFCILPRKPPHEIASRDRDVTAITQQLNTLRMGNEDGLSYMYISGKPGSGKSQLAGLVAKRFYEKAVTHPSAPSFVMTLNAESRETLLESYVQLARQVRCPEYAVANTRNSKEMTINEKIYNLQDLIATKIPFYTSWLLVVDNVISESLINEFLPQPGNEHWIKGQLLITAQDTLSIPSESSFVSQINISKGMEPTDASCFLAMLSGIEDQEMEDKVAKALDYQPLALASAGMYVKKIRDSNVYANFGWEDYLEGLKRGNTSPSYFKSLTNATRFAIEKVMNSDKVMKHILTFLSLCASQPLNLDIVTAYILNVDEGEAETKIVTQIRKSSLLLLQEDENGVHIHLHNIVYEAVKSVVKHHLNNDEKNCAIYAAVRSFNQFIGEMQAVDDNRHLVPHLRTLILEIENIFSSQETRQAFISSVPHSSQSPLYFQRLGQCCEDHSDFLSAKRYYDVALKLIESGEVCRKMDIAVANSLLGNVHHTLGDLQQAKEHLELALHIMLEKLGPEHVDVARTYNNLGLIYQELGDLQQAKEYFELALNINLNKTGPEHVDVAQTYITLGAIQQELGDLEQAEEYFECALNIQLKKVGPEHVDVARTYNKLGAVQQELGDLKQANEYFERASDIQLEKLGPEHVDVARTYYKLGAVHQELGNLEKAKGYFERVVAIQLKKRGPEHVDVASTYYKLGAVHQELGDLEQAKEYFERVVAIQLKKLGPEHVDAASTYYKLGAVHQELGDLEQAKEYFERVVAIQLKKLGPEHVDAARTYYKLGAVHQELGELEQAREYFERVVTIQLKKLGPEHVDVARTYYKLGAVHQELGELEQAKEYFERVVAIQLKRLGPEHVDVARTYNNLGAVHQELGYLEQAKEYFKRAIVTQLERLGPEHVDVARTYNNLGAVHQELGYLEQTKEYFERALDILSKQRGPEHLDVASIYSNLHSLYCSLGDQVQAKEFEERALSIRLKMLGPEHADVASTYSNLGVVQHVLGDQCQAKEQFERALSIRLKLLGPDHVDVARTYINLGTIHHELGELERAKELYEGALAILQKNLGSEHIDVARTYIKLGAVQRELGDLSEAKELYELALDIRLKKLGPKHVDVGHTYNELGDVEWDLDYLERAIEHFELALVTLRETLGPEHRDVATTQRNLGSVHNDLGHLKQAEEHFKCTLLSLRKNLGTEHVDVATAHNDLGSVYRELGDLQLAKEHFECALEILLKLEPGHVDVAITHSNLGFVYRKLGDLQQAKEHFKRALLFFQ